MKMKSLRSSRRILSALLAAAMILGSSLAVFAEETVASEETTTKDGVTTTVNTETTTDEPQQESVTSTASTDEIISSDGNLKVTVESGVTTGATEYYVDGNASDQENAQAAGNKQDVIVKKQVIDKDKIEVKQYITDAEGEFIKDAKGNPIEITENTVVEEIEVVKVKKDDNTEGIEAVDETKIVLIDNKDGINQVVDPAVEDAEEYIPVDALALKGEDASKYAETITVNELIVYKVDENGAPVLDNDGQPIIKQQKVIDDELKTLLMNDTIEKTDNYTLETVYEIDLGVDGGSPVVLKKSEILDEKGEILQEYKGKLEIQEDGSIKVPVQATATYKVIDVDNKEKTIKVDITNGFSGITVRKEICGNKTKYFVQVGEEEIQIKKGDVSKSGFYKCAEEPKTTYSTIITGKEVTVNPDNITTETHYEVYKNGTNEPVLELTEEEYKSVKDSIQTTSYAKVGEAYVVYDGAGEDRKEVATFTEKEWGILTDVKVTYREVTKMYYTSAPEYIEKSFDKIQDSGQTWYKLDVKLFKNSDGIVYDESKISYQVVDDKEVQITIPYTLEDGTAGTLVRTIALTDFGKSNWATLEIKYVPAYTTRQEYQFEVKVTRTTVDSKSKITTTTTIKEAVEEPATGTAAGTKDNPVVKEECANSPSAYKANHIDILVQTDVSAISDLVKAASVKQVQITVGRKSFTDNKPSYDNIHGYNEFRFADKKVSGNQLITILAEIEYTAKDGTTSTFWYQESVYPEKYNKKNPSLNHCSRDGFDYQISVDAINQAIKEYMKKTTAIAYTDSATITVSNTAGLSKEQVNKLIQGVTVTEKGETKVVSAAVDNGFQEATENLIKALMFVRLDGYEMPENGNTHYPVREYSSNLNKELANGTVYLLYTPDCKYQAYGTIGDETVFGKILTFVADGDAVDEDGKPTYGGIRAIEEAYLKSLTKGQRTLIENRVREEVKAEIDRQKAARAQELFGKNYTEEQFKSITWDIDMSALEAQIQQAIKTDNLSIRWYVLKHESDGEHIDGIIVVNGFEIVVNGEVIVVPEIPVVPATPETVTTIQETPTALADTPAVLGANRLADAPSDAAVLGAARGKDTAVLGERRSPSTGDNATVYVWMLAMVLAAGTAILSGTRLIKSRKK